jgi:tetratricopeptide (TPR) repeat protein
METPASKTIPISIISGICLGMFQLSVRSVAADERLPECPDRPEAAEAARRSAGEWFEKGTTYASEERFDLAERAFRCANRLVEHPATLLNLAKAATLAGHIDQAIIAYETYLERFPNEPKVETVQSELAALRREATSPQPTGAAEETRPTEPAETPASEEPEAPQPLPTFAPETTLEHPDAAPLPDPLASTTTDAPRPVQSKDRPLSKTPKPDLYDDGKLKMAGFITLTVGAVGTVTGLILGAIALHAYLKASKNNIQSDDWFTYKTRYYQIKPAAVKVLSVSGAFVLSAFTLLVIDRVRQKRLRRAHLSILLWPKQIGLSFRF